MGMLLVALGIGAAAAWLIVVVTRRFIDFYAPEFLLRAKQTELLKLQMLHAQKYADLQAMEQERGHLFRLSNELNGIQLQAPK